MIRKHSLTLTALVVAALVTATSQAQTDRVRTYSGAQTGEVTKVSPLGVVIERGGRETPVSVADIRSIQYGGEPSALTQARVNALSGAYEKAISKLGEVSMADVKRDEIKQDVAFYKAYCAAKRALMGDGSMTDAGSELNSFLNANRQSYHFLEATELIGDMLVALGNNDAAIKKYELLARSKIPAYKVRSAVLVGKALQAEGKHEEAIQRFSQAETMAGDSAADKTQALAAKLGRAVSLGAAGKADEGADLVRSVIAEADPEEKGLHADAYNALGGCYLAAGQTKEALFAYLHVDLLYDAQPAAHAEALYHLGDLWDTIGQSSKAREARQALKERYAASQWAQK
ncbi:hypothetical protein Pla123a_40640 [Posidoniimonas polymericola]|uniref:Tetratricopeptide repeat protein n=1 Tax=Posidoniimonas polymericola TaxID=2528002 RepID=A0A5C5YEN4_9BACT|nr:hypothetical protein [Posidoniimonas polymericola]TWT72765.1 hypothetical protein Pla123a_40640 [Posidoniimonas polymericola]